MIKISYEMKIIYGITKSNFGGAQRYVLELAKESKKLGHDVSVLCGGNGVLIEKLKEENIKIITIPGFGRDMDLLNDAPRLWFIIKTIYKEKPDVFHINSAKMGGAGIFTTFVLNLYSKLRAKSLVADRQGHKLEAIFTAHGWAFNEPRPFWQKVLIKFFSWLTIVSAHKTICVSDKMMDEVKNWPFTHDKLVVVKNGLENFNLLSREESREKLNIDKDEFVVGTIAELHKVKGIDILLRAWQKFIKNRKARLIIIGEGEEKTKLINMAHSMGISDTVIFTGNIDNARSLLLALDMFVLASRKEGLPYTILEAGFAGLPVISTKVGGIPEIIDSGVNGILIDKEDTEALFSSLILLSEDEKLRHRLGQALKEKIEKEFSLEKMVKETIALY